MRECEEAWPSSAAARATTRGADDSHEVTRIESVGHLRTGDRPRFASAQAREGDFLAELLVDVTDEGVIVALDADRAVRQGRGGILVVAAVVQCGHCSCQHADDAEEVGDRVADGCACRIAGSIAGGGQSGRCS